MKAAYVPVVPQFQGGPFKVLPFRPVWMSGLNLHDFGVFSALLELSWSSAPICYLTNDPEQLRQILAMQFGAAGWDKPISGRGPRSLRPRPAQRPAVFPPLLRAYQYMRDGFDPEEIFRIVAETVDVATIMAADERSPVTP